MAVPQIVLDSNVFLSALRSRRGASFRLIAMVGTGRFDIHVSVPLILEYEEVAKRERWPGKPGHQAIEAILDYLCQQGKQQKVHFLWRPQLRDPDDDMVLELAVAGGCDHIVTFNKKDFAEANRFGVAVITPGEFLNLLGEIP
jgi:putative PIN family toxin of toxin-antitoxin system